MELTGTIPVAAAAAVLGWIALGWVPIVGGLIKGLVRLAFVCSPLVFLTIGGLFLSSDMPGWMQMLIGATDKPTPVPALVVDRAALGAGVPTGPVPMPPVRPHD